MIATVNDKIIRFKNCLILRRSKLVRDDLWIRGSEILNPIEVFYGQKRSYQHTIDCRGLILSPAFIDIQFNGAMGLDFSSTQLLQCSPSDIDKLSDFLLKSGVAGFLPTVISSKKEDYVKICVNLELFKEAIKHVKVLGWHLEGPFLDHAKCGMHPKETLVQGFDMTDPEKSLLDVYGSLLDQAKIVTLAPELENAFLAIDCLVKRGIKVSLGHTSSHIDTINRAFDKGATLITHLFNGMQSFHHRDPNMLGALLSKEIYASIIADCIHSHPKTLKLAHKISSDRICLITDANAATGLADGIYCFGDEQIQVTEGSAYVVGTQTLAGATKSLLECVNNYWIEGCREESPEEPFPGLAMALAAASTLPGKILGLTNTLDAGCPADLVFLRVDEYSQLQVASTWVDGQPRYVNPDFTQFTTTATAQA